MSPPAGFPGGPELFRLGPDVAHLDRGSFGALSTPVARAHRDPAAEAAADPDAFFPGVPGRVAEARRRLAAPPLGADPDGIAFVTHATEAARLALEALRLDADEIPATDHGCGTVVAAAARRARTVAGRRLLAELRERGATNLVDGAHAPGMLAAPKASV
ncbi:hypothetical protein ACH4ZU_13065 [Streptomyces sp. NPDC020472]|uniref:hypothetical protein n=1 Tax=Streptomyces sp. NPDC020472 TaxID=3365075 RepID=UPI0037AB567C